jgi:hypothetical protein
MIVLDTNFLIGIFRDKHNQEAILDMIEYPKTQQLTSLNFWNSGRTLEIEDIFIVGIS